jgi:coenzyme F420-0:L-glutamate ligase/coenzyme F420-1:gamma-L-glutamate ligase
MTDNRIHDMAHSSPAPNPPSPVSFITIPNFPDVQPGDDLSIMLLETLVETGIKLIDGDILALAHKIVSKAESRLVNLDDVLPGDRACDVAAKTGKDPRVVELILQESLEISRMRQGLIIVRHRLGFTSANAGIDRSNVQQGKSGETVLLLPKDPDGSAERLRADIYARLGIGVGIVIADSHGRPFRLGTVGVAIGVAGLPALWDRRGERDRYGYELQHTEVGTADEIASAASLLIGQAAEGTPIVLIRGLKLPSFHGSAGDLVREREMDLYR